MCTQKKHTDSVKFSDKSLALDWVPPDFENSEKYEAFCLQKKMAHYMLANFENGMLDFENTMPIGLVLKLYRVNIKK